MEDKIKPKRILIVGAGTAGTAIVKAITERGKDVNVSYGCVPLDEETLERINNAPCFEPEPIALKNFTIPYQEPFIEKPRKKRRQHLFKR